MQRKLNKLVVSGLIITKGSWGMSLMVWAAVSTAEAFVVGVCQQIVMVKAKYCGVR